MQIQANCSEALFFEELCWNVSAFQDTHISKCTRIEKSQIFFGGFPELMELVHFQGSGFHEQCIK